MRNAESAPTISTRGGNLRERTKAFALAVVRFVETLPRTRTGEVIGRQLLRAGTSVGANYRAACRSRSRREFVAKLGIVEEEADECSYWLETVMELELSHPDRADVLRKEADQLVAIVIASIRTARMRTRPTKASTTIPHSALPIPHSV